ncbi:DEAD/DEAH box helicase [Streptomyces sp. 3MP-14]|uniref:DNA 3'-5' helicase n=1 Tax=Streptomyces mimosae TaxID=2586635 RepID=A0A5N6ASQ3_9ACTN|nr:DEAD/DEAH box helicase [Streptomyces mimosae]KAB8179920.1 DEAD/DEAH box helicase [Streptomyces sp. 3MP-14]
MFKDLTHPPELPDAHGTLRRLRDALASGTAGWRDLASLTRQILLEAQARRNTTGLTVPLDPRLPSREQWEAMKCRTGALPGGERLRITATPWHPPVPDGLPRKAAEEDLRQILLGRDSDQRRKLESYPADPFFTAALGEKHDRYVSIGQRQAARRVALAEPGSTTIVCLPTGHGKTAVAMAPALLASVSAGVSVIVVPTNVLAADLERRARGRLAQQGHRSPTGRYAYHAELADHDRQQMREDIATGRQRVVFTSPESVVGSLKKPLEDASEAGLLRYFVIDEAHLVDQWGEGFRPAFQTMAGHRRTWLGKAPPGRQPITVAMSATLTHHQVDGLDTLFASPQRARIVWAAQLRHEPTYYVTDFPSEEQRQAAVLDAVSYLPKPMILYTTKVEDAKGWARCLRDHGFRRVTQVTGDSRDAERTEALEGWSGQTADDGMADTRYDIVVGTTAFGLGVDLDDVKTIVHACLPDTVDRYYQEVGRAGRDGSPAISYLATTKGDLGLAEHMSREAIISAEGAWKRWDAMFHDKIPAPRHLRVNVDTVPPHMDTGYQTNRQWNLRILNLMVRAGLVAVHPPEEPLRTDGEPDALWLARLEHFRKTAYRCVDVELLGSDARNEERFAIRFEEQRERMLRSRSSSLNELRAALRGDRCVAEVLGSYYRVSDGVGELLTGVTCRGCPYCRSCKKPSPQGSFYRLAGEPRPVLPDPQALGRLPLARYFGDQHCLSIWWKDAGDQAHTDEFVERLVLRGIVVIGGPGAGTQLRRRLQTAARTRPVIVDDDGTLFRDWPGPVIWMADAGAKAPGPELATRMAWEAPTYVVHPRSLDHPRHRGTPLADIHPARLSIRRALEEL